MKLLVVLVIIGTAVLNILPVQAETVTVAGVSLVLEPPPGYCALDSKAGDKTFFLKQRELLRPKVELVQLSVPCDQLEAVRSGKILTYSRWAQVQVISPGGTVRVLPISRSKFITSVTKLVGRKPFEVAAINREMQTRLKGEQINISASELKIVGSDDNAAYLSMAGAAQSEGTSYFVVAFGALTLIKGLPMGVYAYEKQGAPPGKLPTAVAEDYLRLVLMAN